MNVLHLTDMYPLSKDGIHSGGHAIHHLVEALQETLGPGSQQVHLYNAYWAKYYWMFSRRKKKTALLGRKPWLSYLRFRGLLDLPAGKFGNLLNPLWQSVAGRLVVENDEHHIIHVHRSPTLAQFGALIASRHHKPLVITVRREMSAWKKLHLRRQESILAGLNQADLIIAPSQCLAECTKTITGRSAVVIPNGTDGIFDQPPSNPDKRQNNRILFVGTLDENKRVLLVVTAVLELLKAGVDVELHIAGTGALEKRLRRIASEHEEITFLGRVSQEAVRQEMRTAQILCVVSYAETFGIVYAEAMKQGAVVVARDGTGIAGMGEDGVHYELIAEDNELTPLLNGLLDDNERCDRIRRHATVLARKWSWSESAKRHAEAYQSLMP